jgi:hypothetical protein
MKSGTEGWVAGEIVEYADLETFPPLYAAIYTGPSYKVKVLEGKHKGKILRLPANYVEPLEHEHRQEWEDPTDWILDHMRQHPDNSYSSTDIQSSMYKEKYRTRDLRTLNDSMQVLAARGNIVKTAPYHYRYKSG